MLRICQKVCVCAVYSVVCFSRTTGVYIGERLQAKNSAWTSKTLPLRSLCSYSENVREARVFFSAASCSNRNILGRVIDDSYRQPLCSGRDSKLACHRANMLITERRGRRPRRDSVLQVQAAQQRLKHVFAPPSYGQVSNYSKVLTSPRNLP
jgi:hypothetical protein